MRLVEFTQTRVVRRRSGLLYDRPISVLMKDAAAELTPPYTVPEIIAWFGEYYPKVKASSVRAHVTALTANDPNRHHYHHVGGLPAVFTRMPDKTLVPFETEGDLDDEDAGEALVGDDRAGEEAEAAGGAEFVLEAHLEEFLVANWEAINWGRPLRI